MKKITLILSCLSLFIGARAQTFTDGFESDTLGLLGPQSAQWRTWSGPGGGPEDVMVVNTDNHTPAGSKSIHFFSDTAVGGPTDVVLPFSNVPLITGTFKFSSWFKIPTGKAGYFNFQGDTTLGDTYVLDCYFDGTSLSLQTEGNANINAIIPANAWFNVTVEANLNKNIWKMFVDGNLIGTWKSVPNRVFAIDYYPADENSEFWVDDVSYVITPYVFPPVNAAAKEIVVPQGYVGSSVVASFNVSNFGINPITSFDVNISQNNGAAVKNTITGVNITSLNSAVVKLSTPVVLAAGTNSFTATVSNVNGLGPDGDINDDTIKTTAFAAQPALGKNIVVEEGTGTWCQWCPRGAVFMDMMAEKYKDQFIGIAVHNSKLDPMTVPAYDKAIAFKSYPSSMVDRGTRMDPSKIESDLLQRVSVSPRGFIVNGATFDTATSELKVSVTTTIQQNITGDFKVACVITEDSVTGTTSDYDQRNAYAGGAEVMGGFELLSDPVPAAEMNYNFVARALSPNYAGFPNAYGSNATPGQLFTHNFWFKLPAEWDLNQLHIIGLMIDPSGKIENAGSATLKQAIKNGYVNGVVVVGVKELVNGPDAIQLMPNPASDVATIAMNLKTESLLSIDVYAANGALIASKSYGKITGAFQLPMDIQNFSKGIYFIKVNVNNEPKLLKLIKE